jgi:hypothetical protein
LATLWQIFNRVSEVIGNPSDQFSTGYWQLLQIVHISQRVAILGQRVFITLQSNCQRVLDNLYRQEGCPINKERGNLFAIPLKKLKVKINIQEETDSFKNCKRFIF